MPNYGYGYGYHQRSHSTKRPAGPAAFAPYPAPLGWRWDYVTNQNGPVTSKVFRSGSWVDQPTVSLVRAA